MMPDHLPEDPAIIDRPTQNAARKRRKRGFFGGKIPWAVYTFTLIQVCVFIAELAKNGKNLSVYNLWLSTEEFRHAHKKSY